MFWDEAEGVIRSHIETQWALGPYSSSIPLAFENEFETVNDRYMLINIEGVYADKTIYGTSGFRSSIEGGIVFFHSFGREGVGKSEILSSCVFMINLLELRVLENRIYLEGANPPSPVENADSLISDSQPKGQYYRCSGSVPFILIGTR